MRHLVEVRLLPHIRSVAALWSAACGGRATNLPHSPFATCPSHLVTYPFPIWPRTPPPRRPQVDLRQIADDSHGYAGADLGQLVTEAAMQCVREKAGGTWQLHRARAPEAT